MKKKLDPADLFYPVYAAVRKGLHAESIALLHDPVNGRIRPPFRGDLNHAWYSVGCAWYSLQDFGRATDAFKRALALRPDDVDAMLAIGNCYDQQKRPALAARYYLRALDGPYRLTAAERAGLEYNLANVLLDQGQLDQAIARYTALVARRTPLTVVARKNLRLAQARKAAQA